MLKTKEKWLQHIAWQTVVDFNQKLCAKGSGTPHKPGPGWEAAEKLWKESANRALTFREALDVCHKSHALKPFAFFNGNTFAKVMQKMLEPVVNQIPSVDAQILLSTAAHYVAGQIKSRELDRVCAHVDKLLTIAATE